MLKVILATLKTKLDRTAGITAVASAQVNRSNKRLARVLITVTIRPIPDILAIRHIPASLPIQDNLLIQVIQVIVHILVVGVVEVAVEVVAITLDIQVFRHILDCRRTLGYRRTLDNTQDCHPIQDTRIVVVRAHLRILAAKDLEGAIPRAVVVYHLNIRITLKGLVPILSMARINKVVSNTYTNITRVDQTYSNSILDSIQDNIHTCRITNNCQVARCRTIQVTVYLSVGLVYHIIPDNNICNISR